jgi:hypothetical protein
MQAGVDSDDLEGRELKGAQAGEFCAKSAIVSGVHVAQCRLPPIVGTNVIQRSPRVKSNGTVNEQH